MKRTTINLPAGTVLFSPGQVCEHFVVVLSGVVRVMSRSRAGREIVLYRVRPGDVCLQTFGCLTRDQPYSAEGVAETDIEVELMPPAEFHERVSRDAAFRDDLFSAVAQRFADLEGLLNSVTASGFDARLARTLLNLMGEGGRIAATHETLAVEVASGRAAVSRGLGRFASRGLIQVNRGSTVVLAPERLARIADEEL